VLPLLVLPLPLLELPLPPPLPPLLPLPLFDELEPHAVAMATALPSTAIAASRMDRMEVLRLKKTRARTLSHGKFAEKRRPRVPIPERRPGF
jgi:hypothetical protein